MSYLKYLVGCFLLGGAVACIQAGNVFWILCLGSAMLIFGVECIASSVTENKIQKIKRM